VPAKKLTAAERTLNLFGARDVVPDDEPDNDMYEHAFAGLGLDGLK
jgi:hypothetical protein